MPEFIINGGNRLSGDISIQGAKNAVLPLFAAAVLTDEEVILENCPQLIDVENMAKIISALGASVFVANGRAILNCKSINSYEISTTLAGRLRSSIFLLGPLLGRMKHARVAYPGGCDIGLRPIDLHLKAFKSLNVKITESAGYIYCNAEKLRPGNVTLDYPSVGATENIMMLTALSNGVTVIHNAAREPEIEDLQNCLNAMGAKISGGGSSTVTIVGVNRLVGTAYTTMPDRIAVGTFLIATAMCGGKIAINGANSGHISALIYKLEKSGCKVDTKSDKITLESGGDLLSFEDVSTQPYPGFPTDLQAQIVALATVASGTTIITENIFETRFKHIPELIKMGANIDVRGKTALVRGVRRLCGAEVFAYDLRGGAALVLAGLKAEGVTVVRGIKHIERGYENIETSFRKLGADIIKT